MSTDPYEAGRRWFAEHHPEIDVGNDNPALVAVDLALRGGLEFDSEAMVRFALFAQEEVES